MLNCILHYVILYHIVLYCIGGAGESSRRRPPRLRGLLLLRHPLDRYIYIYIYIYICIMYMIYVLVVVVVFVSVVRVQGRGEDEGGAAGVVGPG